MSPSSPRHPSIPLINAPGQFSYESGVTVTHIEPGLARGVLEVGENSFNPNGQVHGGALVTLADTVAGCCACSAGGSCVTANCSVEFLRPALGPRIVCTATPKKMGRSLSVIQTELVSEDGRLVAAGTYTFFMYFPKEEDSSP
ncbi:MAG: PaaI family thioesterase [Lawsonibacter sp.]|nr:PaaI family thioesterase [Lawsonibacter sp.]